MRIVTYCMEFQTYFFATWRLRLPGSRTIYGAHKYGSRRIYPAL